MDTPGGEDNPDIRSTASYTARMNVDRARWLARGAWLLAAAEVVVAVRNHVTGRLSEKERRRMVEIVRASKGRPSKLSDRDRRELKALLDKVEPGELAKTVATSSFAGRFARGIGRHRH
jgi:enhancing lycopene biosynthesis protein 2